MDTVKVGAMIARLRKERGMTQKELADALGISNKTVSKWERGWGCPDLSLWPELSALLGADMSGMMAGAMPANRPDSGNLSRGRFYVCPTCRGMLFSTGEASIFCCGRKLEPLEPSGQVAEEDIQVEHTDADPYVTLRHPMTKDHFLAFAACVTGDRVWFHRLYPEQEAAFHLPSLARGRLYVYCTRHGLLRCPDLRR